MTWYDFESLLCLARAYARDGVDNFAIKSRTIRPYEWLLAREASVSRADYDSDIFGCDVVLIREDLLVLLVAILPFDKTQIADFSLLRSIRRLAIMRYDNVTIVGERRP